MELHCGKKEKYIEERKLCRMHTAQYLSVMSNHSKYYANTWLGKERNNGNMITISCDPPSMK